jgi:hypothetical protein
LNCWRKILCLLEKTKKVIICEHLESVNFSVQHPLFPEQKSLSSTDLYIFFFTSIGTLDNKAQAVLSPL